MNDRDRERQPLPNPKRKIQSVLIEIIGETELFDERVYPRLGLRARQMEQACVEPEVLPDREFGVE